MKNFQFLLAGQAKIFDQLAILNSIGKRKRNDKPAESHQRTINKRFKLISEGKLQPGDLMLQQRPPGPPLQYTTEGGTEYEDVPNLTKIEILWDTQSQSIVALHGGEVVRDDKLPIHPQISLCHLWKEIENEEELSDIVSRFKGGSFVRPRIFLLQCIKFDGTIQGLPVSHIYSTVTYQDHLSKHKRKVNSCSSLYI